MSGVYPTTVSYAGKMIQQFSMAWSFILTFASLGAILMPTFIGHVAQISGIATGMRLITAVLVITLAFIITLTAYSKNKSEGTAQSL